MSDKMSNFNHLLFENATENRTIPDFKIKPFKTSHGSFLDDLKLLKFGKIWIFLLDIINKNFQLK
jgi:hypothetical protein